MARKTRVRFAPSPTGPLHMGGVRTALYNYLFAKQNGGDFIIRIEDTDSQRFVPGAEKYIIEALNWCGIIPDEGVDADGNIVETASERHPHAPYRQSQRKPIYRQYAEQLVADGFAYYAFDTAEELGSKRAEMEAAGQTFIYGQATRMGLRNSLSMPEEEWRPLLESRTDWTIRFKMPENRVVKMEDLIRGHVEVNTSTLDDKVLWKRADELPTYHLANIVDDHLMEITEVIRGEEWLPSLPLHYLLYEAFGWTDTQPRFAHLSLLLKPDGKGKLSKRDGDRLGFPVFPLKWVNAEGEVSRGYREDGYFPEAFVNLLAMLGWNPGNDQELFSLEELIGAFSLERVIKSGARFNADKAKWFNKEYLRMKSVDELVNAYIPVLESHGLQIVDCPACALTAGSPMTPSGADFENRIFSRQYVERVVALIQERATFVADFWDIAPYLFEAPASFVEKDAAKFWKEENYTLALKVADFILSFEGEFTKAALVVVLEEFNAKFENGEFITLLGPSGCGKTTMLRIIAGFEKPTSGTVLFDERVVSDDKVFLPPEKRDIGMVFQSYAVWPHMTVFDNVAYPLRIKKVDKETIKKKVDHVLEAVHLIQYADRIPSQLSGGQQQRVALARALVAEPALLLLDEPLSNLDAKLRESMRFEIKEIQKEYGITVMYVTHDQTEAMAMSDRIVVINRGVIQQIGSPREIYTSPANPFVADFVGKIEFVEGVADNGYIELDGCGQKLPYDGELKGRVIVGIRPEQIQYAAEGEGELTGTVKSHFYLGDVDDCRVDLGGGKEVRVIADPYESMGVAYGKKVSLKVRNFHVFPMEEGAGDFRKILT